MSSASSAHAAKTSRARRTGPRLVSRTPSFPAPRVSGFREAVSASRLARAIPAGFGRRAKAQSSRVSVCSPRVKASDPSSQLSPFPVPGSAPAAVPWPHRVQSSSMLASRPESMLPLRSKSRTRARAFRAPAAHKSLMAKGVSMHSLKRRCTRNAPVTSLAGELGAAPKLAQGTCGCEASALATASAGRGLGEVRCRVGTCRPVPERRAAARRGGNGASAGACAPCGGGAESLRSGGLSSSLFSPWPPSRLEGDWLSPASMLCLRARFALRLPTSGDAPSSPPTSVPAGSCGCSLALSSCAVVTAPWTRRWLCWRPPRLVVSASTAAACAGHSA
mmetsp:Transcript_6185/g.16804  ORF Transcript_6185/g.16804 Transcript_6185/m.16804 type:complete len:334 (-) Transcript_6185:175-1176(-)